MSEKKPRDVWTYDEETGGICLNGTAKHPAFVVKCLNELTEENEELEELLKGWITSYCGIAGKPDDDELPPWRDTERALAKRDEGGEK